MIESIASFGSWRKRFNCITPSHLLNYAYMKNRQRRKMLYAFTTAKAKADETMIDGEWLNMIPTGREFGSKDYDRLMEHYNLVYSIQQSADPTSFGLRVFLDDERVTPEGWVRVYWPNEAIDLLETRAVAEISLDHDLGNDERGTGYDVVLWIEEAVVLNDFTPPKIKVHSANSSARQKMEAGIQMINKLSKK